MVKSGAIHFGPTYRYLKTSDTLVSTGRGRVPRGSSRPRRRAGARCRTRDPQVVGAGRQDHQPANTQDLRMNNSRDLPSDLSQTCEPQVEQLRLLTAESEARERSALRCWDQDMFWLWTRRDQLFRIMQPPTPWWDSGRACHGYGWDPNGVLARLNCLAANPIGSVLGFSTEDFQAG